MNQSGTDSGQSMEDILASIRRIIAEGEQDAKDGTPPAVAAEPAKPAAPKAEVFELTQVVQDDGSVVTVGEEKAKEPAASPASSASSEPAAAAVKAEAAAVVEKLVPPEALAEKAPAPAQAPVAPDDAKVETAMAALSRLMDVAKAPGPETSAAEPDRLHSSLTVEELVRDALKPLLRQWLDANLPPLVERAVREAVDKLAKRAG
jgi:cell pole-organizing protein PopZ